jgi:hypothetical protein
MVDLSYLKGLDFTSMGTEELLSELNKLWLLDPKYPGECPDCDDIHDILLERFRKLPDEELLTLVSPMDDERLEQIAIVLETLWDEDEKEFLKEYAERGFSF